MTLDDFKKFKVHPPPRSEYLGMWEDLDVCFVVFSFPNRAKLRVTFWKPALQLLVCVKDYLGVYKCIGNNVKSLEAYQEILNDFNWRDYDAGIEKAPRRSDKVKPKEEEVNVEELQEIRSQLANIANEEMKNVEIPQFGSIE